MIKINAAAINNEINEKIEALHAVTPRAKCRRVYAGDRAAELDAALAKATDGDEWLVLTADGGAVANSYGSAADGDKLTLRINLITGGFSIVAQRTYAPKCPHGRGAQQTIRIVKAGQTRGREV